MKWFELFVDFGANLFVAVFLAGYLTFFYNALFRFSFNTEKSPRLSRITIRILKLYIT